MDSELREIEHRDNQLKSPQTRAVSTDGNTDPAGLQNVRVIEKQAQKRIFKIIVIGDSNVGKTCLTYRFCSGKFPDKTEATIGVDFREKQLEVDGENLKLQLWDTAGQERFRKSMVQHYYRNVHAVIFVYDITKMSSFENMSQWIEECDRHNLNKNIPRILVGNKCDEVDKVAVNTNMAQKFADAHGMPLFETSAKDDDKANHVDAIFMTVSHKLKNAKPMMPVHMSSLSPHDSVNLRGSPQHRGLQSAVGVGAGDKSSDCSC
ncbi:putative Ras-related protein Rab-33 [Aplysia californica]|uniref:Ras-related protein Rab-33 n=1 Tax=Aplysia californica TaxID=6500 RepID=A0ABM0JV34_APLCA|nr:putative Ras-related protein Rab-33 [Aplysia californica]